MKSKAFQPALTHWILATTEPRDTTAQDAVNQINQSFQRRHTAELWFWEDISDLLDEHHKVAARFYVTVSGELTAFVEGTLCAYFFPEEQTNREKLQAFFSHPLYRNRVHSIAPEVSTAVLVAVDNCLHPDKGKATRMSLEFDGVQIRLGDNGVTFDPFNENLRLGDQQHGVRAIRALRAPTSPMTATYESRDGDHGVTANTLSFTLNSSLSGDSLQPCTAFADAKLLFNRRDAFAMLDALKIPEHCDPYVLRLTGDSPISISGSHQLILQIKQRLGSRKLKVLVGAHRAHIFEALVGHSSFREQFEIVQE